MASTDLSSALTIYNDKEMASQYSDYKDKVSTWEEKIADIKNGKLDENTFINDIENYIIEVLKDTNRSDQWTVQNENKLDEKCPECGSDLVIKKGKYGKFIACSN